MDYCWDGRKSVANLSKHGIDFSDAVGVFEDDWALTLEDPDSQLERRFVTVGVDFRGRILVVAFSYEEESIRVISARVATNSERRQYEQRRV